MGKKYLFLSDVVNTGGTVFKDQGPIINRGETLELDPEAESTKWLLDSRAIESIGDAAESPGNSLLDKNAEESIKLVQAGNHDQGQLEELLAYEKDNKNRKTVIEAITNELEKLLG